MEAILLGTICLILSGGALYNLMLYIWEYKWWATVLNAILVLALAFAGVIFNMIGF